MVRCKMVCNQVAEQHLSGGKKQWQYGFNAVYGTTEENKKFWEATPSGALTFQCMTTGEHPMFECGKEYYVDLSPAS